MLRLGSVQGFLSRALEPPCPATVQHTVDVLRNLGALEKEEEELTPLGYHLGDLPVDARIGKMMIYGCIFRCLDPVLTIAASISHRSPFVSPMDKREAADKARRGLCAEQSDHLTVLKAYNGWLEAKAARKERDYCSARFLSHTALVMISDLKRQFAQLLSEIGFVRRGVRKDRLDRMKGDGVMGITGIEVNQYSTNWRMVEGVLVAGLYPNLIQVEHPLVPSSSPSPSAASAASATSSQPAKLPKLMTSGGEVFFHPSSKLAVETALTSPFLVYHEKVKTSKIYVRDASVVTPYMLLLFGGDLTLNHDRNLVTMDGWITLKTSPRIAVLSKELQAEVRKMLILKIEEPESPFSETGNQMIAGISKLLEAEQVGAVVKSQK